MKSGGWVPLSKYLTLPKDREYSEVDATYSLQRDYDAGNPVTVAGYAALWRWSRGKVERFLESLGVVIQYPDDTGRKQNQRGQIVIQIASRSRAENGQKRLIDSKGIADKASRSRADDGQKASRSQGTTIDPNPDPDPEVIPPPTAEEGKEVVSSLFSDTVMWIANELARLVLANNPKNRELQEAKREATVLRWAKDIDKMIRLDKREPREVTEVVRWCQKDSFWSVNILSASKLREKYDMLLLKMKSSGSGRHQNGDCRKHSGLTEIEHSKGIAEDGRF